MSDSGWKVLHVLQRLSITCPTVRSSAGRHFFIVVSDVDAAFIDNQHAALYCVVVLDLYAFC